MTGRGLVILFAVALVVRTIGALIVPYPAYVDSAYYELVGRQLAEGAGFTTPALWSFLEVGGRLPEVPTLPLASNGHWMPLTSILAAGSMTILGTSHLAAQLPSILLGALLVLVTAWIADRHWHSRRVTVISAVLALTAGPMLVLVPQTDSFALFGVGGCLALVGATRAVRGPSGAAWLLISGFGVGLATLVRIDGLVLAIAPATTWLVRRGVGPWRTEGRGLSWRAALASASLAALVMLPWLIRQQLQFGTPFPSAGGHTLWISSYNEQFSIGHPVDLSTYLASGPLQIMSSKIESWFLILGRTAVILGGAFVLAFFYGLWRERRRPELAPFIVYWIALFALMGGLFTFHAPQGAWYHSAWAWLPFAIPFAAASFEPGVAALGRRARLFAKPSNQRFLANAAVGGAILLSAVGSYQLVAGWSLARERLERTASLLAGATPHDVVMAINPPAITLETGLRSVPYPYDPYPVMAEVVRAYDVRWVVVERSPGESEDPLGLWTGGTAVDAVGNRATFINGQPAFEAKDVRVFATRDSGP